MPIAEDQQHLDLLGVFHFVVGGIIGLCGCLPIIHLVIGIAMLTGAIDKNAPAFVGIMFVIIALICITMSWTLAACMIVAGLKLRQHAGYTFCLVIAAVECLFMPFGTVLGVFTIIVLVRPYVKELFGAQVEAPQGTP
jgi:hypothetical protein